jgi:hypothetical protein
LDGKKKKVDMHFTIEQNKLGYPYLKKAGRARKVSEEGRGQWVQIGKLTDLYIEKSIRINESQGYFVLLDDEGYYRALVLTE